MLDEALIKFVEPIGPGQIVDRESLVALPAGLMQMTIEVKEKEVTVRVLAMKEESLSRQESAILNWHASAFVWQNGQVIAAEKMEDRLTKEFSTRSRTMPRIPNVKKRRTMITPKTFRFVRDTSDQAEDNSIIDAILQICIYKSPTGGVQRKLFVGTVHVALNYLTAADDHDHVVNQSFACEKDWFKIFPKSSFLPGCPSSIAKSNCAISGKRSAGSPELEETSAISRSERANSSTSLRHPGLKRSPSQTSSVSSNRSSERCESSRSRVKTDPNPSVTRRVASWVRQTLLRQSSLPDQTNRPSVRTPDSETSDVMFDMPPVLVGPKKRQADPSIMRSIPESQHSQEESSHPTSSTASASDRLPVPNVSKSRIAKFRTSRSNNSSFDVGYESGRSRYLSSSDEEQSYKSAESNLDVLSEKEAEAVPSAAKETSEEWFQMEIVNEKGKIIPRKQRKTMTLKQRQSTLQRSARISCDDGFTSLNEMQRRGSRGSQDSAIFANS